MRGTDQRKDDDRSDPATGRSRIRHDWEQDEAVSTSIIEGVATVTGDDPTDIESMYEVIDPDALDQLAASFQRGGQGEVRFVLNGCEVTIDGSGEIVLHYPE